MVFHLADFFPLFPSILLCSGNETNYFGGPYLLLSYFLKFPFLREFRLRTFCSLFISLLFCCLYNTRYPIFCQHFLKLFLYYLLIIKLYVIIQIIYSKYKNRASTFSAICSHKTKKDPEESFPCCLQGSFFRILFS